MTMTMVTNMAAGAPAGRTRTVILTATRMERQPNR